MMVKEIVEAFKKNLTSK